MFFIMKLLMKLRFTRGTGFSLCCACMLLFGIVQPLLGQSKTGSAVEEQQSDDAKVRPKKLSSKSTWEHVVSFPGTLIYLPLDLSFELIKGSIDFVTDSQIIPKVQDFLTSDDGRRGVMPAYAARTGGGLKFYQKGWISQKSKLSITATAGPKRRQNYELEMKRVSLFGNTLSSDFQVGYQFLSNEAFFGIGPGTDKDDESDFALQRFTPNAAFGIRLSKRISLDTTLGVDVNDTEEGKDDTINSTTDLFTEETLPGLEKQISLARLQVGLKYDSRNRPGNPSKGSEVSLGAGVFEDLDADEFGFWKFSADLTQYIHLFYNRTLALRISGEVTNPFSDREVPFYYLSELGRQESIRGFKRGRFRDRDMVLASAEYRYPIWEVADAMLFVDVGQVAEDIFSDLSTDDVEVGYGGGFRVWGDDGLITSFVIGRSDDGFRFYFGLN